MSFRRERAFHVIEKGCVIEWDVAIDVLVIAKELQGRLLRKGSGFTGLGPTRTVGLAEHAVERVAGRAITVHAMTDEAGEGYQGGPGEYIIHLGNELGEFHAHDPVAGGSADHGGDPGVLLLQALGQRKRGHGLREQGGEANNRALGQVVAFDQLVQEHI